MNTPAELLRVRLRELHATAERIKACDPVDGPGLVRVLAMVAEYQEALDAVEDWNKGKMRLQGVAAFTLNTKREDGRTEGQGRTGPRPCGGQCTGKRTGNGCSCDTGEEGSGYGPL